MVITSVGAKSGNLRKNPVMRVERDGAYLAVASKGGAPEDPAWADNFLAHPEVELQDRRREAHLPRREPRGRGAGRLVGARRGQWPTYAAYQEKTDRRDPAVPARTRLIAAREVSFPTGGSRRPWKADIPVFSRSGVMQTAIPVAAVTSRTSLRRAMLLILYTAALVLLGWLLAVTAAHADSGNGGATRPTARTACWG